MTSQTVKVTKGGGRLSSASSSSNSTSLTRLPEEQATLLQEVPMRKGTMNHSYRDYSKICPSVDYAPVTNIDDMSFSEKVHSILSNPAYGDCIAWMPHGRAFKVTAPLVFEREVLPKYFGHGRYSSFLRSLNNYGFKHITKGTDRNCYYHELVLRGHSHLCRFMPRCRDARRLTADPDNEPNFYCINQVVGAPDSTGDGTISHLRSTSPLSSSSSSSTWTSSMNSPSLAAPTNHVQSTSSVIANMTRPPRIQPSSPNHATIQHRPHQYNHATQRHGDGGDVTVKWVLAAFLLQQLNKNERTAVTNRY